MTWLNRHEPFSCWRPIWFSEYKFLLKFCLKDPLWLHIDHKDALVSLCSDARATSHPTRTVTISLAPAMCKGENILLPSEYLFPNRKYCMSKFPPCQVPEEVQQEPSQSSVLKNKTNQNLRWRIPLSPPVKNITSRCIRAPRAGQPEKGERSTVPACMTVRGCLETPLGLPSIPLGLCFLSASHPLPRRLGSDPTGYSALCLLPSS